MKIVPLNEVKDDLSRYLRLAEDEGQHRDEQVHFGDAEDADFLGAGDSLAPQIVQHLPEGRTRDDQGRDLLSTIMYGGRISLAVGGVGIVSGMAPRGGFDAAGLEELIARTRDFRERPPGRSPGRSSCRSRPWTC